MNLTAANKYVLGAFIVIAVSIVAGATTLVYAGKMMSGDFLTLAILILSIFGAGAVVHTTGQVIQQTNGQKETTTTTMPSNAPVTVTTTREPSHD